MRADTRRPSLFRTARRRLVAWNVGVLTLILVLLGTAVYYAFSVNLYREVDQQLRSEQERVLGTLIRENLNFYSLYSLSSSSFGPAYRIVIATTDGKVAMSTDCPMPNPLMPHSCPPYSFSPTSRGGLMAALSPTVIAKGYEIRTSSFREESYRVLSFPVIVGGSPEFIIQISRPVTGQGQLRILLIVGALLGIILSALGSIFLANRALIPIRQAFARQRQFTADASHELRTPLALIRANAEMLERHADRLPEMDGELITEIIRETDHLNRLVGDLLTLARADAEQIKLDARPVDLRALVAEVHEDVQRIAESRGIASHIALDGTVVVDGDETRLRQLLLILLDNALKYTDPGGQVDVALEREDGQARLLVSDTGIGIPANDLPHIFDRFYRVDRAREHESGGTGLGLAIAQWIVQAHHGTIKVDSESGRGTQFEVELPAVDDGHTSPAHSG